MARHGRLGGSPQPMRGRHVPRIRTGKYQPCTCWIRPPNCRVLRVKSLHATASHTHTQRGVEEREISLGCRMHHACMDLEYPHLTVAARQLRARVN
jgi:hypothetical protein